MEKPFKRMISIVAAVFIYLAASGFSDGLSHCNEVEQNSESPGSPVYVAEELPFLAGFALKEGANFFSGGSETQISLKQHQLQKAAMLVREVQVACAIRQNISQHCNNPVRLRKSDMLFPFHYFFESNRA